MAAVVGGMALAWASVAFAGARVVSLDQCADQYVLAFAKRGDIAGLSRRADQADSYLRARAANLPRIRADLEAVLAARPAVVVRSWGGDLALLVQLRRHEVRVVSLADAASFADVEANMRQAAAALGGRRIGEAMIARLDEQLAAAAGAGGGERALYLSPGGETAGPGTLMDAILRAAGYANAEARAGYHAVSLEALALLPPRRVVAGFLDADPSTQLWSVGRHALFGRLLAREAIVGLPAAELACPSWTAGEAVTRLAAAARGR